MIQIRHKQDCVGCGACAQRCPRHCITLHEDEQGFLYPKVNSDLCIECGLCEIVCPVINQAKPHRPENVYAARNLDNEVRMKSSSGGVFFALAKTVIEEGGVVFGARFNEQKEVVHDYAETLEEAAAFRGSKYVQSRIGDTFSQAEKFLKDGRKVLFSGTPCQIAGLRLFLRKEYENLIAVDVVCHGTPSPLVWREYLRHIARPTGARAGKNTDFQSLNAIPAQAGISFRDKKLGWEKYGFSVRAAATAGSGENSDFPSAILQNEEKQELFFQTLDKNLYMQIFLKNLDLRPSCYACPAKCGKSHSDITLADFWGIKYRIPEAYDFNGVSLVMANTPKGKALLDSVNLAKTETTYEIGFAGNPSIEKSSAMPKQYEAFWKSFHSTGFDDVHKILSKMRPKLYSLIKRKIKSIISRILGKRIISHIKSTIKKYK